MSDCPDLVPLVFPFCTSHLVCVCVCVSFNIIQSLFIYLNGSIVAVQYYILKVYKIVICNFLRLCSVIVTIKYWLYWHRSVLTD